MSTQAAQDPTHDGATRSPSRSCVRLRCWVALPLVAAALVACEAGGEGPEPAADELAEHEGRPCPELLLEPEDGAIDPAPAPPDLEEAGLIQPDRMWVCDYELIETLRKPDRDGTSDPSWRLRTAAVRVPDEQRDALLTDVAALEPTDPRRACTLDLGPRRMLVLSTGGNLTGVVVDDFGCRDARMTDEPHATVPGEASAPGTVAGVLSGPEGLADRVAAVVG